MNFKFNNITDLLDTFSTEKKCKKYLEQQRWQGEITCPHCGHDRVYRTNVGFKCANNKCYKKFSVTVGTIFENSNIKLQKWFMAIYLFTSHKRGVSSCQLARDLGIGQKAAWFMLHRIREAFTVKEYTPPLTGEIELDESYFGGKIKNKHAKQRRAIENKTSPSIKAAVFGILGRNSWLSYRAVKYVKQSTILPIIGENIERGATIYTDSSWLYNPLKTGYKHEFVNHEQGEFARGTVHTNSIEGAFSQMKRGVYGTYYHISPKHLQRYCDEFAYRYNHRKVADNSRFSLSLTGVNRRLSYKELIADEKTESKQGSSDNGKPK